MMKNNLSKKTLFLFLFAIAVNSFMTLTAQTNIQFEFRKDHTFKIAQFTDLHWDNKSPKCALTAETIKHVLAVEKPDLAILTGDIVTDVPAKEGWLAVSKIFANAMIPWAITLGNHDAEPEITRDQIFGLLQPLPYFAGSKGPELYGCGNYNLPVKASDGKSIAAVIYCFDSNDYPRDKKIGNYDWIHFDQIDWYRKTSDKYTGLNNKSPVPSLAFFHIPLVEFKEIPGKESTVGINKGGVGSSIINAGLFASMFEKKDIMGVFVGHDHSNNYIGVSHDICLAYGQVTGADASGAIECGSRIIDLHEGEFRFDSWIRTKSGIKYKYNYPPGFSIDDAKVEYLPATQINDLKPGVSYNYFEGSFKSTAELASAKIKKNGILKNISIETAAVLDSFAFEFKAWLKIPKKGVYSFYTYSDDGSKLFIDGKEVVNNDGSHGARRRDGKIALDEGFHEFRLLYFEDYMGNLLEAGFSSISIRECKIPDNYFYTNIF